MIMHCTAVAGSKRRWSMDILASIFAYLVCMTGLVTGLVMSFVVLFAAPNSPSPWLQQASAKVAKPGIVITAKASPVRTIANIKQHNVTSTGATAEIAPAKAIAPTSIAADARQKPLLSPTHLRRLTERARAKRFAFRERSSFETRFLHFDD